MLDCTFFYNKICSKNVTIKPMKPIFNLIIIATITALITSCTEEKITPSNHNAIYYWKTKFKLDSMEENFLRRHNIDNIYVKMFDLIPGYDDSNTDINVIPDATTLFASTVPNDIEIIPVTYITIEALRSMQNQEDLYASLIVERIKAMCRYNGLEKIQEMQLDCDWTKLTKASYVKLCSSVKEILNSDSINLSITIRLHQLNETPPPSDKGVLMVYNTGALKNYETNNSILDTKDIKPYLMKYNGKCTLPLSYAFPAYGWGVKFINKEFVGIVAENTTPNNESEEIRIERPKFDEIIESKRLIEKYLGTPANSNILYHLDINQLKNYTDNEIDKIFAR